jgi:hypothetical protein
MSLAPKGNQEYKGSMIVLLEVASFLAMTHGELSI